MAFSSLNLESIVILSYFIYILRSFIYNKNVLSSCELCNISWVPGYKITCPRLWEAGILLRHHDASERKMVYFHLGNKVSREQDST